MDLDAEGRSTYLKLFVASLLLVGCSLLVNDLSRYLEWDEAIYFAEVSAKVEPIGFSAHRARGTSLLALPVALVDGGVLALRAYILALFGLGSLLSFRQWAKSVGASTAVGALAIFGTNWLALFYSIELSPNLFVALVSVGLTGVVASGAASDSGRAVRISAVLLLAAVLALLRPLDAAIIGVSIAWFRRHDKIDLVAVLSGLAVGAVVWAAEALLRFGGIWGRIRQAAYLTESTGSLSVLDHLRLLDGGLVGPDHETSVSVVALVWMVVIVVLAVIGFKAERERVRIALVPGLLLLVTYTSLVGALAPRFLLPAYGLLAIPAGVGLRETWFAMKRRPIPYRSAAVALIGLLLMTTVWHVRTAAKIAVVEYERRTVPQRLGEMLDEVTDDSCAFASEYGYPQVAFASGCVGRRIDVGDPESVQGWFDRRQTAGDRVFVVVLHDPLGSAFFESWPAEVLHIEDMSWTIYGLSDRR